MAEGDSTYAEPGDHSKTALHNKNYRGLFENTEGTKGKTSSIRTPPIPASEIRAPEISMNDQEISQLKLILHDCVQLFSHKEIERKKSDKSKKYLLLTIMILSNLLSIITTTYLTHMFRKCPENNNLIPKETLPYHPTIPTVSFGNRWLGGNTEGTPDRDQWLGENTEGTPDIEAQITINVQTESPKQERSNTTATTTYGSIWD